VVPPTPFFSFKSSKAKQSLQHVFSQKDETSEYEQIQAKRREEQSEEQRKMLEEMKMASMALAQSFAPRGNINKTGKKAHHSP